MEWGASPGLGKSPQAASKIQRPANTLPGLVYFSPRGWGTLAAVGGGGYGLGRGTDNGIGIQGWMTPSRSAWLVEAGRGDNYLLLLGSPAGRAMGRSELICRFWRQRKMIL